MVGTMMENVPTGEKTLQYQCKVTVLETKCFPDLQKKFLADPKAAPVPALKPDRSFCLNVRRKTTAFIISVRLRAWAAATGRARKPGTR